MIKWSFPSRGDGDIEGFSNPALEWFKGNPLCALAREVCQNSLDAQHDDNKPVDVVFAKTLVDTYSFPGLEELGDILHKCRDFWRVKGNEKTMGFLDNAQKDLKGNKISYRIIGGVLIIDIFEATFRTASNPKGFCSAFGACWNNFLEW